MNKIPILLLAVAIAVSTGCRSENSVTVQPEEKSTELAYYPDFLNLVEKKKVRNLKIGMDKSTGQIRLMGEAQLDESEKYLDFLVFPEVSAEEIEAKLEEHKLTFQFLFDVPETAE